MRIVAAKNVFQPASAPIIECDICIQMLKIISPVVGLIREIKKGHIF
jgi:hypothetical protein